MAHPGRSSLASSLRPLGAGPVLATSIVLTAAVGFLDRVTGPEVRLFPLYFLPVALAAMVAGRHWTVVSSVLASGTWLAANLPVEPMHLPPAVWGINVTSQLIAFATVGLLVGELRTRAELAEQQARADSLTGLRNARGFAELAAHELSRHRRLSHSMVVAYVDLDDFKRTNEVLGHLGADELLARVANLMRASLRASDVLARLGGDEFAVLMPECGEADGESALRRLQQTLATELQAERLHQTCSIGAVVFSRAPNSVEEMLRSADQLMYEVKRAGKDGFRLAADPR